jgi:hypothetical protein
MPSLWDPAALEAAPRLLIAEAETLRCSAADLLARLWRLEMPSPPEPGEPQLVDLRSRSPEAA